MNWNTLRRWLCRKFNLVGAETTFKVIIEGHTIMYLSLEYLRDRDQLREPRPGPFGWVNWPQRKGEPVVTFDWKP